MRADAASTGMRADLRRASPRSLEQRHPGHAWKLAILGWVATRGALVAMVFADLYGPAAPDALGDVDLYHRYADEVVGGSRTPYTTVDIEYPPGAVLVFLLPYLLGARSPQAYRIAFVVLMLVVDLSAALGLGRIARLSALSQGWAGMWLWIVALPLLGPVVLGRFDLIAVAAVIWAFERVQREAWLTAGALLGVGTAIKLYPLLLVPLFVLVALQRSRVTLGVLLGAAPFVLLSAPALADVASDVIGYHSVRGIHHESIWGNALQLLRTANLHGTQLVEVAGSRDVVGGVAELVHDVANIVLVVALVEVGLRTWRVRRDDVASLATAAAATTCLAVGLATVSSVQFVTWVVGAVAIALCVAPTGGLRSVWWVLGAAWCGQLIYPITFEWYLQNGVLPVLIGLTRNVLILLLGAHFVRRILPSHVPLRGAPQEA